MIFPIIRDERFFRNLLIGEHNEFKNRYCHIRSQNLPIDEKKSENTGKNLPVNKTQQLILDLLKTNPSYTYDELAERTEKTRETVRVNLRKL